jgi:hypothetical protein
VAGGGTVFDWIIGSILCVVAMFFGLIWSSWSWGSLRWLGLRRTGTPTTGVVISQVESDLGRTTRIRFTADGTEHEFLTDEIGPAASGDVVPVHYDPRRPRRVVYPVGTGQVAAKLVGLILLPTAFSGVLIVTMPDAGVTQAVMTSGFLAGAILGGWLRSRPTPPAKRVRAAPGWLVWWSDHQGDVLVVGVIIGLLVVPWILGDPPWRMPIPLLLGAVAVPYLITRWATRGWRELIVGVVFALFGVSGTIIDTDPKLIWQALCAAIVGLVLVGVGLRRIPRAQKATAPPVLRHSSPVAPASRVAGQRPGGTSPGHMLRPAVPPPPHGSSPPAQRRPAPPAIQPPPGRNTG